MRRDTIASADIERGHRPVPPVIGPFASADRPCTCHRVAVTQPTVKNMAHSVFRSMCERWNDRQHASDLLNEHFVREDRRPLIRMPDSDRDGFAAVEESMWALDAHWPSDFDVAATRGDRLMMSPGSVTFGDGASRIEYLVVFLIDENNLAERLILFEPEQEAEAIDVLGRLAEERGLTD
jgi:hypothetical protein